MISLFIMPFSLLSQSKDVFKQILVTNKSGFLKFNAIVEIPVPEEWKDETCIVMTEAEKASILPFVRKSTESKDFLLVQLTLAPYEEKKLILKKTTSSQHNIEQIVTSNPSGTDFLFVNYKEAILISTEEDNEIQFFSNEGKQFSPESNPLILGEGKSYILHTNSPQLVNVKSAKPIYIYASSMNYNKDNTQIEAGDSDTTTLYTNFGYIYVYKHLWISSYEETKVNILDETGRNVFQKKLNANTGIFIDDLIPGSYKVTSEQPVTIQFGYLDDENFSFVYGQNNRIHGFAFGDLLIQSLYPDTSIQIEWNNKEKQKYLFKQSGEIATFKKIENFLPKKAEYIFFRIETNHPIKVCSFSSGNNFGGEFITGHSFSFKDKEFQIITTRVSKEFSKEQRNLIELIGLYKDTNVVISGSIDKKLTLQENTLFDVPSGSPLEKIIVESKSDILVCQLHNYTNKGLFYVVPSLSDNTTILLPTESIGEGIFQDVPTAKNSFISWFRIKEALRNTIHLPYLPLTLFFVGLIGILVAVLLILLNRLYPAVANINKQESTSMQETEIKKEPLKEEESPILEEKIVIETLKKAERPFRFEIPDLSDNSKPVVYPTLPKANEIIFHSATEKQKQSDEKPVMKEVIQNKQEVVASHDLSGILPVNEKIKTNVVLDPGSANRLFYENQLTLFQNAYIVANSIKKLPQEILGYLHRIDLNLQDQARISNLLRSLPIMEESAKAIAICKKMKIAYYISSYPLPPKILDITIIPINEWKQYPFR